MQRNRFALTPACAVVALFLFAPPFARAAEWKAGVARVKITPEKPMWMSGYAARTRPADPQPLHDLWAKALAIDDGQRRAVVVTMDLLGVSRDVSQRVRDAVKEKHGLGRESLTLCSSHTHSGPVIGQNLRTMYFLDAEQNRLVDDYTAALEQTLVKLVGDALADLSPAKLEWGNGRATFAVNRRTNTEADVARRRAEGKEPKGPSDHDLPVLAVRAADGKLKAVLFGYACHATTLSGQQWSGDWPGFAQEEVERDHPGATALFFAGCGADQNPIPRGTVMHAKDYGRQAADGVKEVASGGKMKPLGGALGLTYSEIDLPFADLPPRSRLEADAKAENKYVASRAQHLLATLDRDGKLSEVYPYPVQVWKLGDGPTLALLGGEVVVDYALRLKQEFGERPLWVAGYANDVMAYIASRRVLKEGGYEGIGAMVYYGLPAGWSPETEDMIVKEVHRLAREATGPR